MLSLALRGVCFTAKCCFCYLLAQCQEEARANSFEGWGGEEILTRQHEDRAEPAGQQVAEEQDTEEVWCHFLLSM